MMADIGPLQPKVKPSNAQKKRALDQFLTLRLGPHASLKSSKIASSLNRRFAEKNEKSKRTFCQAEAGNFLLSGMRIETSRGRLQPSQIPAYQDHPFWMLPCSPPSSRWSVTTMRWRYFILL
jgi:hypothetical protein